MKTRGSIKHLVASAIRRKARPALRARSARVPVGKPSRMIQAMLSQMPQMPQQAPAAQANALPPAMTMNRNDIIARALDMMQRQQAMQSLQSMNQP